LLVTCGGSAFDGADLCVSQFKRICDFARCIWLGQLCVPFLTTPDRTQGSPAIVQRARDFGRRLARQLDNDLNNQGAAGNE
jgi:hypothetical protein